MKPERTPQTALIEQLHRLHDLCKSYDNGMCVAMDIAVALRTLLHDSPNGRSLSVLTQCGLRDKVKFLDTTAQRGTISFFAVGDNVSNKNIHISLSGDGDGATDCSNDGRGCGRYPSPVVEDLFCVCQYSSSESELECGR